MTEKELNEINEELSQYKKWLDDFRIVGSGVSGHTRTSSSAVPTEQLGSFERLQERMAEVRGIVENFRIRGEGVSGSFQQGYKVGPAELGSEKGGVAGTIPPPVGCATTITIEVSGLIIRTDCIPSAFCFPGANGVQYNDIAMNNTFTLSLEDLTEWCGDGSTPSDICIWSHTAFSTYHYHVCEGFPFNESDESAFWTVAHADGVWYVMGTGGLGLDGGMFFYAEASSTSLPFSNLITAPSSSCRNTILPSSRFFDIWWGDCTLGSGDQLWTAGASGGTVTITV